MKSLRSVWPVMGVILGLLTLWGGEAGAEEVPWMGANGWMQWHPHRSDYTLAMVGTQTYFGPGAPKMATRGVEVAAPAAKPPEEKKPEIKKPEPKPVVVEKKPEPKPVEEVKERCPGTPKGVMLNDAGCWKVELVNFDFDKARIRDDEKAGLNEVAKVMKENAQIKLEIQGHTDSTGPDAYNQKLSERRAKAVTDYLMAQGVADHRMKSSGYSFSKPLVPNDTRANRAINRRVEILPKY